MITELLNKEVNLSNKPYIISHGTYHTVPRYCGKFDDGKIHAVYAGSFNPVKGGALTAIGAAEYLDENYDLPDRREEEAVKEQWDGVYDKLKTKISKMEEKENAKE